MSSRPAATSWTSCPKGGWLAGGTRSSRRSPMHLRSGLKRLVKCSTTSAGSRLERSTMEGSLARAARTADCVCESVLTDAPQRRGSGLWRRTRPLPRTAWPRATRRRSPTCSSSRRASRSEIPRSFADRHRLGGARRELVGRGAKAGAEEEQQRHRAGPARLMARADAGAVVAVEVLVEEQ